jgi:hypothetical protein
MPLQGLGEHGHDLVVVDAACQLEAAAVEQHLGQLPAVVADRRAGGGRHAFTTLVVVAHALRQRRPQTMATV